MANLVPWMTFLSLADYFMDTYGTNAMEFQFPVLSTAALVVTSALLLVLGSRLSFNARIALPTVFMTGLIFVVPSVDVLLRLRLIDPSVGFNLTLLSVPLNAMFSASAQNSLYALASLLGDEATQALQTGNGVIGMVAVCLRVATKLGLPPSPAMWTFCLGGAAILFASLCGYTSIRNDPSARQRLAAHEQRRALRYAAARQSAREMPPSAEPMLSDSESGRSSAATCSVLGRVWVQSASVFAVFVVCLSTFPGLTTSLESTGGLGSWYPIALVAAYNSGDLLGKGEAAKDRTCPNVVSRMCM